MLITLEVGINIQLNASVEPCLLPPPMAANTQWRIRTIFATIIGPKTKLGTNCRTNKKKALD